MLRLGPYLTGNYATTQTLLKPPPRETILTCRARGQNQTSPNLQTALGHTIKRSDAPLHLNGLVKVAGGAPWGQFKTFILEFEQTWKDFVVAKQIIQLCVLCCGSAELRLTDANRFFCNGWQTQMGLAIMTIKCSTQASYLELNISLQPGILGAAYVSPCLRSLVVFAWSSECSCFYFASLRCEFSAEVLTVGFSSRNPVGRSQFFCLNRVLIKQKLKTDAQMQPKQQNAALGASCWWRPSWTHVIQASDVPVFSGSVTPSGCVLAALFAGQPATPELAQHPDQWWEGAVAVATVCVTVSGRVG